MTPWLSLALLLLGGVGLVLRHDLAPWLGIDTGIISVAAALAGAMLFSRTWSNDAVASPEVGPGRAARARRLQVMVAASCAVAVVGFFTWVNAPDPRARIDAAAQALTNHWTLDRTAAPSIERRPARIALALVARESGQFVATTRINRNPATMLVDTGATRVVLNAEDARQAGITPAADGYTVPVETAAGTLFTAPAKIAHLEVGPLAASDVAALVARPGHLDRSLLGNSFLSRLARVELSGNILVLESPRGLKTTRTANVSR